MTTFSNVYDSKPLNVDSYNNERSNLHLLIYHRFFFSFYTLSSTRGKKFHSNDSYLDNAQIQSHNDVDADNSEQTKKSMNFKCI